MVLNLISSQLRKQFRAGGMASPKLSVLSTLSKKDIVDEIAETYDLPKAKSKRILTTVLDTIVEGLADDRSVRLNNFGSFESYESKARTGRNPNNGNPIHIPAQKRIRFKPSASLKQTINGEK